MQVCLQYEKSLEKVVTNVVYLFTFVVKWIGVGQARDSVIEVC